MPHPGTPARQDCSAWKILERGRDGGKTGRVTDRRDPKDPDGSTSSPIQGSQGLRVGEDPRDPRQSPRRPAVHLRRIAMPVPFRRPSNGRFRYDGRKQNQGPGRADVADHGSYGSSSLWSY